MALLLLLLLQCDTLQAAAAHMGVEPAVLEQELGAYAAAAEGRQADGWGKRYFPTQVSPGGPFWVAQVTPVVHYCMGGLRIDAETRVSAGRVPMGSQLLCLDHKGSGRQGVCGGGGVALPVQLRL